MRKILETYIEIEERRKLPNLHKRT